MNFEDDLRKALLIINELHVAVKEKLGQFKRVDIKPDGTFVTEIDYFCDNFLQERISSFFPGDAILSEESGITSFDCARRWIVDPIDGTYNLVRGLPYFATLLALEVNGEIVIGVIDAHMTGDRYWAVKGGGAYKNGELISMSEISSLADSHLIIGELNGVGQRNIWSALHDLTTVTKRQRGFGDYAGFGTVFEGKAEFVIEPTAAPWDLAPMKILAQESGGVYLDLDGGSSIYAGGCVVGNRHVVHVVRDMIAASPIKPFDKYKHLEPSPTANKAYGTSIDWSRISDHK